MKLAQSCQTTVKDEKNENVFGNRLNARYLNIFNNSPLQSNPCIALPL